MGLLLTVLALASGLTAQQSAAGKVTEPAEMGAVYFQSETGNLLPLERPKVRKIFFSGGFEGVEDQWLIRGGKSPVRVNADTGKTLFVVRLAPGVDPASFSLLVLKKHGSGRWLKGAHRFGITPLTLPFNVTGFGQSSYRLTPATELSPGEYAFAQIKSNEAYCFGVGGAGEGKHAKNR